MNPLAGMAAVVFLLGALLGILAVVRRQFNLSGEITRKATHIVICVFFRQPSCSGYAGSKVVLCREYCTL